MCVCVCMCFHILPAFLRVCSKHYSSPPLDHLEHMQFLWIGVSKLASACDFVREVSAWCLVPAGSWDGLQTCWEAALDEQLWQIDEEVIPEA